MDYLHGSLSLSIRRKDFNDLHRLNSKTVLTIMIITTRTTTRIAIIITIMGIPTPSKVASLYCNVLHNLIWVIESHHRLAICFYPPSININEPKSCPYPGQPQVIGLELRHHTDLKQKSLGNPAKENPTKVSAQFRGPLYYWIIFLVTVIPIRGISCETIIFLEFVYW